MFGAGKQVEVISDGRVGTITNTHGSRIAVNMPGSVETVENCLVRFGNDITNVEWFTPEQLRPKYG
jgi:hypothetical protein